MSRPHDCRRPFFAFGNPFKTMLPKRSSLSPKLAPLLNSFEQSLAERIKRLIPKEKGDALTLSWMKLAIESLAETHTDVKTLINDLQFPASEWDDKWMDAYLEDSGKLLDISTALTSQISKLDQGMLMLNYSLHLLDLSVGFPSTDKMLRARDSLLEWMYQSGSKALRTASPRNSKLEHCSGLLQGMAGSLCSTKLKSSTKGKVLLRALYGVKAETLFVCCVFTAALSGTAAPLMDLCVPDEFLWSSSFNDLKTSINGDIRRLYSEGSVTIIIKEMEAVDGCVINLNAMIENVSRISDVGEKEATSLGKSVKELRESVDKLVHGLDLVSKQLHGFFQIVLGGRDALLCNLRVSDSQHERNEADVFERCQQ
ncbi:UPF0496 protein 4 [Amborella trichopoda]|uniref:Protein BPS1, chloroplastic n=1 Tax=Amborella trichopoda TaxID=13333 RepID=W1NKT8_AMBTC|nr:UPF0496 protein 4 [Amborella trichopoda]ERM96442.1 hypothetical protein AMTR_s00001p00251380 [Amborella trichopoda]|eukprot:XP_006829026.1 UPF0496 protein 4 [Amborella trichopoda]